MSSFTEAVLGLRYHRFLGRFAPARRTASLVRALADRSQPPQLDDGQCKILRDLRVSGISPLPSLPEQTRLAISRFARARSGDLRVANGDSYSMPAVPGAQAYPEQPPPIADVANPRVCPEIARLAGDQWLLDTARAHLGYRPKEVAVRLFWSFVTDMSDDMRRAQGQTIDFHYDIDGLNSTYLFFYIEGGEEASGAHVAILGSHARKSLAMIMGSAFQPEVRILKRYGAASLRILASGPGSGFFEDPACFHKALVPTQADRLCLQFRYI